MPYQHGTGLLWKTGSSDQHTEETDDLHIAFGEHFSKVARRAFVYRWKSEVGTFLDCAPALSIAIFTPTLRHVQLNSRSDVVYMLLYIGGNVVPIVFSVNVHVLRSDRPPVYSSQFEVNGRTYSSQATWMFPVSWWTNSW